MKSKLVEAKDFQHSVPVGSKSIINAVYADGYIYTSTAREFGFSVVDTKTGKLVSRIDDRRLQAGLLAGKDGDIYAAFYYKLFKVNATSSTELLSQYGDDMFGVVDVHISGAYLIAKAHNGIYVFNVETYELLAAFRNTSGARVSSVNFYYNPVSERLYVADLNDEKDYNSLVLCADAKQNFEIQWQVKLPGKLSASAGTPGINHFYEAEEYLICPIAGNDINPSHIAYLDKNTGETLHTTSCKYPGDILFTSDRIYLKHYQENQAAALDMHTREVLWTCDLDPIKSYDLKLFRDHLYLYRTDKKSQVIHTADGSSEIVEGALGVGPVYGSDLRVSDRYFVIDSTICWND